MVYTMNFVTVGKIPGECIFIHKKDFRLFTTPGSEGIIKCIAIDFESKKVSDPVTIMDIENVCPHDPINSEEERMEIQNLVLELFSKEQIKKLNERFEHIRYQG